MLKIKDNVDLKELEKFGFKPIFSKTTGEIYEYELKYENNKTFVKLTKHLNKLYKNNYRFRDWLGLDIANLFKRKDSWSLYMGRYLGSAFDDWQFDLVYDLIKADLVFKLSDEK